MKCNIIGNGPSRLLYVEDGSITYGCNIPLQKVDKLVISDREVIDAYNTNRHLIPKDCTLICSVDVWQRLDLWKLRPQFKLEHLYHVRKERFNTAHYAAVHAISNGFTQLKIYGCDSYHFDSTTSSTDEYINNPNKPNVGFVTKQIADWRIIWNKLMEENPTVTFEFVM